MAISFRDVSLVPALESSNVRHFAKRAKAGCFIPELVHSGHPPPSRTLHRFERFAQCVATIAPGRFFLSFSLRVPRGQAGEKALRRVSWAASGIPTRPFLINRFNSPAKEIYNLQLNRELRLFSLLPDSLCGELEFWSCLSQPILIHHLPTIIRQEPFIP